MAPAWEPNKDRGSPPLRYPDDKSRVPHISLVFREMWDNAGLDLKF